MDNNRRLFHINVTRQCQLACSHCYIDQAIRDNNTAMSTDTLQDIANVIKDTHADVHIIGGEPTLVSIDTHKQYLSILSTLKNSKIMIVTALQNARAVKVASLYQNIATSFDPNARTEINNNKWLARCRALREQGHNLHVCVSLSQSVIDYGVSKVLDEIYAFEFKSVHLAAMVPTPNALNETPDPMITSQAMIESAQWVLDKRKTDKNIFVSPFDGLLQGMSNEDKHYYEGLMCPAGQQCVNVEPNGQIHACVAKGGKVSSEISGNVKDIKGVKDIKNIKNNINNNQTLPIKKQLSSNAYRLEVAQHNRTRTECLGCEFWQTCKGGCRVLANTEIAKQSPECAGFKTFLNYVKEQAAFVSVMMSINLNGINSLYAVGVHSFFLKEQRIKVLEKMIKQEHWINNENPSKNNEILCVPEWMHKANKTAINKTNALKNPYKKERINKQNIKRFMPVQYFDYFTSVFNAHQYNGGLDTLHYSAIEVVSVALWNGVGDFNWHWDGPGNDDIYALVYLSDYQEWPQEFGAGLEYGTAQMSESEQGYKNIEQKGVFYPDNGRIVIGENRNPLWVHRTQHYSEQALKDKINRFTFLVTMKLTSLLPDEKLKKQY